MKKFILIVLITALPLTSNAWIRLNFPPYFSGHSVGIKGAHDFDDRGLAGAYFDASFIIFTGGVEIGYHYGTDTYMGKSVNLDYKYLNPYIGVHLPLDPFDIYAVGGIVLIDQSGSKAEYDLGEHTAFSAEYGLRTAVLENRNLALGIGYKQHFFKNIHTNTGDKFKPNFGMLFINIGYYWDWD